GQLGPLLLGNLGKAESVGGRTEQYRGLVIQEKVQASGAAHSPTRQAQAAEPAGRVKRRPEAEEWAERKRKEKPIVRTHADDAEDALPAAEQSLPALRRVQPAERLARCPRCLVQPAVALERIGQDTPIRRMGFLVRLQLGLGRERQTGEIVRSV